jgi:hypothetical protein
MERVSAVANQLRGKRRSRAGGPAVAKGAPSVARFYIQPETSVSAIVLPSGSLTQAALKRPASKTLVGLDPRLVVLLEEHPPPSELTHRLVEVIDEPARERRRRLAGVVW